MTIPTVRGASSGTVHALLEREAFDLAALYRAHHRLVGWIVRGAGVRASAVEDVVQDVFVAAHRRRAMAPEGDLRRWLIGVARSVIHAHRRGERRYLARVAQVFGHAEGLALDDALDEHRTIERVRAALGAMPDVLREAFVLVEWHGAAPAEVADMLGISRNTVYSRVRLARARLAAVVGDTHALARPDAPRSSEVSQRTWMLIAARIGWRGSVVRGVIAVIVLGTGVGVGLQVARLQGRASEREIVHAREPSPRATSQAVVAIAPPEPRGSVTPPAAGSSHEVIELVPSSSEPRAPAIRSRTGSPRRRASPSSAASTLAEEASLLQDAARSLDRGALERGRTALHEHAERHPHGTLAAERLRLERELRRLEAENASP